MKLLMTILFAVIHIFSRGQSVYSFSVPTIEGQSSSMQEFQGKKVFITILPITQSQDDTIFLQKIDSFAVANAGQYIFIAVLSYEDGYNDSLLSKLKTFYRSFLDTTIRISQGLYTHQLSGSMQNPLFNWLTHVNGNTHFEKEVTGPGQMYFINEQGELYAVIGSESKFSNEIFNKIVSE